MVIYYHAPGFVNVDARTDFVYRCLDYTNSGNLAVVCFFFISGILVSNSLFVKKDTIKFLISRIFRLVPGLVFVSVGVALIGIFFSTIPLLEYIGNAGRYVWHNSIMDIIYTIPGVSFHTTNPNFEQTLNGSLWTIPIEFKMYLMVLALWIVANKFLRDRIDIFLLITIFSPFIFSPQLLGGENPETLYLIPSFFCGTAFAYYKNKIELNFPLVAALAIIAYIIENPAVNNFLWDLTIPIALLYISSLSILRKFKLRHDISYGIYLWGWPAEHLVTYFLSAWIMSMLADIAYFIFTLISISVAAIFAYISCIFVEEPFMRRQHNVYEFIREKCPLYFLK